MARRFHETIAFQRNAGVGEEVFDFRVNDRVMTVDGLPGKVVALNSGPFPGSEDYEVVLDSGMGGGSYTAAQLKKINPATAALHEAAEVTASIPVEAITSHTADLDYPELGTILYDRPPNENVKLAATAAYRGKDLYGRDVWDDADYQLHHETCEHCEGAGSFGDGRNERDCHNCGGSGKIMYHVAPDEAEYRHEHTPLGRAVEDAVPHEEEIRRAYAKTAANKDDEATKPQSSQEDPGQRMDQEEDDEEPNQDENNTDTKAAEEPADEAGKDDDDAGPPDIEQEKVNNTPDVTPPSACSFCGADAFEDPQMTGRGVRMRCSQCGGTMKSWGGQWEPEFPNSPQNAASGQSDSSQGGAAGVANAPGANFKTTKLQLEAGIINWVVDKIYDRIEERKNHEILGNEWAWQTGVGGPANHDTNYADYHCPTCYRVHPQTLHPEGLTVHGSLAEEFDSEWKFHFTASWQDVQAKAKRIRKEGGVKILVATNMGVAGEVKGEHNVYEAQLNYVLGTKHVADWSCGCKWASYTWGRSPAYRRFEGRLCSHALALQYEANARGMFGKEVQPDTDRPKWQYQRSPVQVQHQRGTEREPARDLRRRAVPPGNMRRTFSSLDTDGIYETPELIELRHAPIFASIQTMAEAGEPTENIIEMVASHEVSRDAAKEMIFEAFHVDESNIRRDGDEYETPDGDRFNHGTPNDQDQWNDPEFVRANQRDLSDHDHDAYAEEHKRRHHRTNDAREHAMHWGWGFPAGVPIETCGQCNGSGCGHCAGQGQVALNNANPAQTNDAGDIVSGISVAGTLHTADYSSADPLAGVDQQTYYSPTNHSNSRNPASTGWATSQDPGDWGRSIMTNNFGLTTDSALDAEPTVAGVLLRANDTGRLLMIQRALSENDKNGGLWEMPGGHLEDGEKPLHGAVREFEEETGHPFPQDAFVVHTWRSGPYRGHLVEVPSEQHLDFSRGRQVPNPDGDIHEHVAWWDPAHAKKNPALRPEMKKAPWEQFVKAAGRHSPQNENLVQYSYERGLGSGYSDPTADAEALAEAHEHYNPGMKYHFLEGFQDGVQRRHYGSVKEAGSDKYVDTQYGDGGSASEHRFAQPARMGTHCPTCARPLLPHEMADGQCEDCLTAHEAPDFSGGHAQHVQDGHAFNDSRFNQEWNPHGYELHRLHTNSTLVNDPDEVGALPYTTGEADGDVLPGQSGGSSGDASLPHASTDALHGGTGAHTTDSLHQAFLNTPAAQKMMAEIGLTKSAMKDFSYAEQQDLINEGQGSRARNYGDLKIAGTHYEHLKDDEDGDLWI